MKLPKGNRSELRIRQAPTNGYEAVLVKRDYDEITGQRGRVTSVQYSSSYQEDATYVFRVRTRKDAQGNTVSALHGVIYGDFRVVHGGGITFTFHLNPDPSSRNLEFDRERDLK